MYGSCTAEPAGSQAFPFRVLLSACGLCNFFSFLGRVVLDLSLLMMLRIPPSKSQLAREGCREHGVLRSKEPMLVNRRRRKYVETQDKMLRR